MKSLLFCGAIFLCFGSLFAIQYNVTDVENLFFFNSSIGFNFTVKNESRHEHHVLIEDGTATWITSIKRDRSVFYTFNITQDSPSIVKQLNFTIEMQKSKDDARVFVNEFVLSTDFDYNRLHWWRNWTEMKHVYIVKPPRFPHFQVKTDWKYECPKELSLTLCHVENATNHCSVKDPYSLVSIKLFLKNVVFHGGKNLTHNYGNRIEECPLAYETRKDIGIACIVVFWSIAAAFALWGLIKYLLKRHRKFND